MSSLCRLPLLLLLFSQVSSFAQKISAQTSEAKPLPPNVNTDANDLFAFRYADKLYFSTEYTHGSSAHKVSRTFSVLRDSPAFLLPENPNDLSRNMAYLSLNLKANRIYYTLFKSDQNGAIKSAEIWYRDRNYDGTWGRQNRVPEPLNIAGYLASQPAFGHDRISGKELLFFVSNRPGGKGGMDIWVSEIKPGKGDQDDGFGEPVNLPFNTPGDELSPYFDTRSQTLLFSSDSLHGLGGFDIFSLKKTSENQWTEASNLGDQINSICDEQCFSYHQPSGLAYFSSNRPSANCNTSLCKNFDVYQKALSAQITIKLINAQDKAPVPEGNLTIEAMKSGEVVEIQHNSPDGLALVRVVPEIAYLIKVTQKGFSPVLFELMVGSEDIFTNLEKTVLLKPIQEKAVDDQE